MRSAWKIPHFFKKNIETNSFKNENKKFIYKIRNRNFRIVKSMLHKKYSVYNGRRFTKLNVGSSLLGVKFGELIITRGLVHHQKKKREKIRMKKIKEELKKKPKVKIVDKAKIEAARRKRKSRK